MLSSCVLSPLFRPPFTTSARKIMQNDAKSAIQKKSTRVARVKTEQSGPTQVFSPRRTRNQIKIHYEADPLKPAIVSKQPSAAPENVATVVAVKTPAATLSQKIKRKLAATATVAVLTELNNKEKKWEPDNWRDTLKNLREMRKSHTAPVDLMGCAKCSDDVDEKSRRFHILVSLMLSSQTKDQINYEAMKRLRQFGLTPAHVAQTDHTILEKLIFPCGFYKNKAKFIKKTAQILLDTYDGDIPNTVPDLIQLPGVGPKMAHICMSAAWKIVSGIGVDTHVHRISNRLRWVETPTKEPEKTRIALERWLPFELWDEINLMLVGFGQTVCTPLAPKCGICINQDICPSRGVKK